MSATRTAAACALLAACAVAGLPGRAMAQADPNGPAPNQVKVRVGPVLLNPSVSFANIGVDENVFNEPTDPKRDFTMTISPKTDVWLRFLGTWFTGTMNTDTIWYQKYSSERAANNTYSLNWKLPLTRVTANLFGSHTSTRERPGFEIDERAKRSLNNYSATVNLNFFTNTSVDFTTTRDTTRYDETVRFDTVSLQHELDATGTTFGFGLTRKLTPLTTATVSLTRGHDRFTFNPIRDSNSTEAGVAVRFDAAALLKGNFSIAYTKFSPLAPEIIPGFSGLTLAANLSYTLYDVTRIAFRADRAVQNSYDIDNPYYVQAGFNLELSQQVFGRLDVVGRGGTEALSYRDRLDLDPTAQIAGRTSRRDRWLTYGIGLGYHLGRATRIGFNYDKTRRNSPLESRRYERPNIGTSVTYDF